MSTKVKFLDPVELQIENCFKNTSRYIFRFKLLFELFLYSLPCRLVTVFAPKIWKHFSGLPVVCFLRRKVITGFFDDEKFSYGFHSSGFSSLYFYTRWVYFIVIISNARVCEIWRWVWPYTCRFIVAIV